MEARAMVIMTKKEMHLYIVCKDGIHQKTVNSIEHANELCAMYGSVYTDRDIAQSVYNEYKAMEAN